MRCLECGTEIPESSLFCPKCGCPVQMVPDYTSLEDMLADEVNGVLEADRKKEAEERLERRQQAAIEEAIFRGEARSHENEMNRIRRKKKRTRNIILIVLGMVCLAALTSAFVIWRSKVNSFDYQISKADRYFYGKDYTNAMLSYDKASKLQEDSAKPYVGIGRCYEKQDNAEQAEAYYLKAVSVDPESVEAYQALIEFYEADSNPDEIRKVLSACESETVLAQFPGFLTDIPAFSVEPGTYQEPLSIEITAAAGTIHYTTDGSPATAESPVYDGPLSFTEEGEFSLHAVSVSENGIVSDNAAAHYVIDLQAPANPVVYPKAGLYEGDQTIEVTADEGCTVYYTLDGSDPDENAQVYSGPIDMPEGESTFSCIAVNGYGLKSSIIRRAYNLIYIY